MKLQSKLDRAFKTISEETRGKTFYEVTKDERITGTPSITFEELKALVSQDVTVKERKMNGVTQAYLKFFSTSIFEESIPMYIQVKRNETKTRKLTLLLHEWAHYLHRHYDNQIRLSTTEKEREIQAEATAYVVGSCIGIKNRRTYRYIAMNRDRRYGTDNLLAGNEVVILGVAIEMVHRIEEAKAINE